MLRILEGTEMPNTSYSASAKYLVLLVLRQMIKYSQVVKRKVMENRRSLEAVVGFASEGARLEECVY